jgi:branched-chain amino acid transport system substrate-binding protein
VKYILASSEKPRRDFMKYAATAIVCGVVAGVGGYFGGAASVPAAAEKTVTETKTVGGEGETVTKTVTGPTTTVTKTVGEEIPAPSGTPIKIGFQSDLTGTLDLFGRSEDIAFKAAAAYCNELGGIDGRPVEVITEDTEGKADVGMEKFRKMVLEDECVAVLGSTSSGIVGATCPLALDMKIPYLSVGAMSHTLTGGTPGRAGFENDGNRWHFRLVSHVATQVAGYKEYGFEQIANKWTTMYWDYSWGQSHDYMWTEAADEYGGSVVAHVPIPLGTTDFFPYVAKVPAESEAAYPVLLGAASIGFLTTLYDAGYSGQLGYVICLLDGIDAEALGEIVEDQWTIEYYPRELAGCDATNMGPSSSFYRERCGIDEHGFHQPQGWMATNSHSWPAWEYIFLLKEAMENTGWKSKADNELIIKYLEDDVMLKRSNQYPLGDGWLRADDHQGLYPHWISRIDANGKVNVVKKLAVNDIAYTSPVDYPNDFPL